MRTFKILLLVLAINFTNFALAEIPNPLPINHQQELIQKEVKKLLKKPNFGIEKEETVIVKIILSEKNEIVVLSVNSKNENLNRFIKHKLNYKKVPIGISGKYKKYILPVKFKTKK